MTTDPDTLVSVRYLVDDVGTAIAFHTRHRAFRSEVVSGPGGRRIVLDDPAGNAVELSQPRTDPRGDPAP